VVILTTNLYVRVAGVFPTASAVGGLEDVVVVVGVGSIIKLDEDIEVTVDSLSYGT